MGTRSRDGVAITGLGVVSPAGCSTPEFWSTVCGGRSTAAPLSDVEFSRHPVRFACRVTGLTDIGGVSEKEARRMDPFARFGVAAAMQAYADAGGPTPDPDRTAIVVGNAVGGRRTSDDESQHYVTGGPQRVSPLFPLVSMPNAAAAQIAIRLGWRGPALSIATTCASGADAIGIAAGMLLGDQADIAIAGGCESIVTPVTMAAFGNLNALSARNEQPHRASRPFDADRDGFVLGEGAGFVVLERLEDARARGAQIYGMLTGYAATADAYHLSMPRGDGAGAAAAMASAIARAGLAPSDIMHINAHGTSTVHNDRAEASAIRKIFGSHSPPVTSTKGVIGHLIGAAGAVEFVAAVLAMRANLVPPTANHERIEPGMDIDVVHTDPRPIPFGPALSNSFGFGGHNSCLVVIPA